MTAVDQAATHVECFAALGQVKELRGVSHHPDAYPRRVAITVHVSSARFVLHHRPRPRTCRDRQGCAEPEP